MSKFGDFDPHPHDTTKRRQITVHFSDEELEIVQLAANRENVPRNQFIRNHTLQFAKAMLGIP